jgi:hypothetical protein
MIQERVEQKNSDFSIIVPIVQFYNNNHNSQYDLWIRLNIYLEFIGILFYVRVKFQDNQSSGRPCDIGKNMLYEFCYLLSFDLRISYLTRILFLQGYKNLF